MTRVSFWLSSSLNVAIPGQVYKYEFDQCSFDHFYRLVEATGWVNAGFSCGATISTSESPTYDFPNRDVPTCIVLDRS